MQLGLVTYNWAKDWDLPTLIKNCEQTGFEGVELRSTHLHGVEPTLTKAQRSEVSKRFSDRFQKSSRRCGRASKAFCRQ